MRLYSKLRKSITSFVNRYKFALPLLTFFGMVAGLIFVTSLSKNLIDSQINAANSDIYWGYECDIVHYDLPNCGGDVTRITHNSHYGTLNGLPPPSQCGATLYGNQNKVINCKFIGCYKLKTGTTEKEMINCPTGVTTPTSNPTNTTTPPNTSVTPTLGAGKGCGEPCTFSSECQSGFSCDDIDNDPSNKCWSAQCAGPALRSRIEGVVRGCSNEKLSGVKVWAWGNTAITDSNGKYRLSKGVNTTNITVNETSILAGADASKNPIDGYFMRDFANIALNTTNADTPDEACSHINCLFNAKIGDSIGIPDSHKLLNSQPSRYAYRIQKSNVVNDDFYEQNFVYTDYWAKSFDFKKIDCPIASTNTPTPLSCNDTCTTDAQCAITNTNWYCAGQPQYEGWYNESTTAQSIEVLIGDSTTEIVNFPTTDINVIFRPDSDTIKTVHLVKNGRIYARKLTSNGWQPQYVNVTQYVINESLPAHTNGSTGITGFNSYKDKTGAIRQHVVRDGIVYYRGSTTGTWQIVNINKPAAEINSLVNSYTANQHFDGYMEHVVVFKNGKVYRRDSLASNSGNLSNWVDITYLFSNSSHSSSCFGSDPRKCGTTKILALETSRHEAGYYKTYVLRDGGSSTTYNQGYIYTRLNRFNTQPQKCRLKSNPWSQSCQP